MFAEVPRSNKLLENYKSDKFTNKEKGKKNGYWLKRKKNGRIGIKEEGKKKRKNGIKKRK